MAEQEVIKHTKKVLSIWGNGNTGFWHKLKEFLLEIFIIVFAVTLSIYLHERSEKKHVQHETKEFLLGLKKDLLLDATEMKEDKESFVLSRDAAAYIISIPRNSPANRDSVNKHFGWLVNVTGLVPNDGRFEGFKSAGKIGTISNKDLQNNIMDLYQEDIPSLLMSTNNYSVKKQKLLDYLQENRKRVTDSTTNLRDILSHDQVYNICNTLIVVNEIFSRYDSCISKIDKIVAAIDKDYK